MPNLEVVLLEGTPNERGLIHGEMLKLKIDESIKRTRYFLKKFYHASPKELIKRFTNNTNFIKAVKKWTPDLLKELESVGDAAGVDFDELFFLQCMDESGWCFKAMRESMGGHCSGMGCYKEDDTPTLIAQTLDWNNINEGLEVLFRIKYPNSSLECLVPSIPGVLGLMGLNNSPIGITTNALWTCLNSSLDGLPVNFIVRGVLEQESLEDAINFIKTIQHASAENYIIGDIEKVVDFECSKNKICQFIPHENPRRIYHTNHPIINNDYLLPLDVPRNEDTSWERFEYLKYRLNNPSDKVSIQTLKYILSSHFGPICVHHNFQSPSGYTQYTAIYSLKSSPELYITNGPACLNEFKLFTLKS